MLYACVAALAFQAPVSEVVSRRSLLQGAASAAVFAPLAAFADGASSPAVIERSRALYGSRVFRLQDASPEAILEEENALVLYTTGAYPRTGNSAFKDTQKELKALTKKAVASAKKGDKAGANAAVKEFIKVGGIKKELDLVDGGNFNPKQRRNPGAPPTSEIEAQMGTQAFALYQPLKPK